ncbi:MAG: RNA polymerase sigma-70 factor [Bacteroidia bacterium]
MQDDHYLLQLLSQADDSRAFACLFNRYHPQLRLYAIKLCASPEQADEIVSDVFVNIWRSRHLMATCRCFKSYMYAATRNRTIDYLRSRKHRPILEPVEAVDEDLHPEYSPEELIIKDEAEVQIKAAIDCLPPQGRRVFQLSRDEGMKYREIADHLHVSIKTVETHMRRSLIALRQELAPVVEGVLRIE